MSEPVRLNTDEIEVFIRLGKHKLEDGLSDTGDILHLRTGLTKLARQQKTALEPVRPHVKTTGKGWRSRPHIPASTFVSNYNSLTAETETDL